MESKDKAELINLAIQKIREERKNNEDASSAQEDQLVISNLLSQLESLEGGGVLKQPGGILGQEEANSSAVGEVETEGDNAGQLGGEGAEISREEIINELRHVKRQNFITHCLLSAMIFLTLSWQLSEVKLILKVRDGINHPFKAVGSMLKGMFKRPRDNGRDAEQQQQHEAPQHSPFKMPELPHMDLPELVEKSGLHDVETKSQCNQFFLLKHFRKQIVWMFYMVKTLIPLILFVLYYIR